MSAPYPFAALKDGSYRVVLADPPWAFKARSDSGLAKSPQAHYDCMDIEAIKALPVASLAHPDGCALIMWGTAPMLPQALETMAAWGFAFKSAGGWAKQSKTGARWAFGTGYLYRSAFEPWLLGVRGRHVVSQVRNVRNLIVAPVREHSRKPDQMIADIEAMFPGPRVELFCRERRPGWDCWGNQTDKFEAAA